MDVTKYGASSILLGGIFIVGLRLYSTYRLIEIVDSIKTLESQRGT